MFLLHKLIKTKILRFDEIIIYLSDQNNDSIELASHLILSCPLQFFYNKHKHIFPVFLVFV